MNTEIRKFARRISQLNKKKKLYISMRRGGEGAAARMSGKRLIILN